MAGRAAFKGQDITIEAAGDLSLLQFTAVKYAPSLPKGQACTVTGAAASDRATGILQNRPAAAGLGAVVRITGCSKLKVDGTVAIVAGDPLAVGAGGVGVKAAATTYTIATAMQAVASGTAIIEVQLTIGKT